ncbi:hypothetical protein ACSQ67_015187 [Phaseolus vulgaris]
MHSSTFFATLKLKLYCHYASLQSSLVARSCWRSRARATSLSYSLLVVHLVLHVLPFSNTIFLPHSTSPFFGFSFNLHLTTFLFIRGCLPVDNSKWKVMWNNFYIASTCNNKRNPVMA